MDDHQKVASRLVIKRGDGQGPLQVRAVVRSRLATPCLSVAIAARIVDLATKLATTRLWRSTTLAEEFGVADVTDNDLYAAMDWLLERQDRIQSKLAARHLGPDSLVLYDLSSSYFEGTCCPLFDQRNLVEIEAPEDYPGERLIACRNEALAKLRAHKRESLIAATEAQLHEIAQHVATGKLRRQPSFRFNLLIYREIASRGGWSFSLVPHRC
ncbi:MAG: hypothetical protein QM674_05440 [Burkholderiaceae bacterium]